jgi:hypothetical protein
MVQATQLRGRGRYSVCTACTTVLTVSSICMENMGKVVKGQSARQQIWGFHGADYEECRLLGYKNPVCTSQGTHYVSVRESSLLMLCEMWGFHGCDYEECRLLGYKNPVCTSQGTYNFSVTVSSLLMLCEIWGFHGCDYEECRLLWYKNPVRTSQKTHYVSVTEPSQFMLCKIWGWMSSSGMLLRVVLVKTDDSRESSSSIIRVTRIGELGTTLGVTSNRCTLRRFLHPIRRHSSWCIQICILSYICLICIVCQITMARVRISTALPKISDLLAKRTKFRQLLRYVYWNIVLKDSRMKFKVRVVLSGRSRVAYWCSDVSASKAIP